MSAAISHISSGRRLLWRLHICVVNILKGSPSPFLLLLFIYFCFFFFFLWIQFILLLLFFKLLDSWNTDITVRAPWVFEKWAYYFLHLPFLIFLFFKFFVTINISIYMQIIIDWPRMDKNSSCFHCGVRSMWVWRQSSESSSSFKE